MSFENEDLDLVLVLSGLLIMFVHHIIILYRYIHLPHTTVVDKRDVGRDVGIALSVISSNTSAATFLCSISLTLSSLIGAWIRSNSSQTHRPINPHNEMAVINGVLHYLNTNTRPLHQHQLFEKEIVKHVGERISEVQV
ncbi:unnamed protein product [Malus baccata var. baccata]